MTQTPETPGETTAERTSAQLDDDNLTRQEAAERTAAVNVQSVTAHLDLSEVERPGATTFPVRAALQVTYDPQASEQTPFLDYLGASVEGLSINGEERDVASAAGGARILLEGLTAGENTIEVRGTSRYSRSGEGLHRYEDPDGSVYLYSQCESADARRIIPVFDQPSLKARFGFTVTGPESWLLRSNSPETGREPAGEGLAAVTFAETAVMSSYLIAFVAGPYHEVTQQWTHPERDLTLELTLLVRKAMAEHLDAENLFTITKQGLDFFHTEFGYPYPWGGAEPAEDGSAVGKYEQVFVPEYNAGAMENPGLVVFTERLIFDTAATEAQHELRANVIMHEMAHMWFGDLVTMHWWDDLWLKESFADYMGSLAVDEATDFETAWVAFANGRKAWAYVQDQLPTTHPIVADIPDLQAAHQNFDGITYAKGASVLKQLAAYAGRDAFRQAAQRYFARHAFGNTGLNDFLSVLEETTGKDMHAWSEAWLQTAGIPVLEVEVAEDAVNIRQTGIDPTTGGQIARPHVVEVGLYVLDDEGRLSLHSSAPLELTADAEGGLTPVPGLVVPEGQPRLILPNEQDLTYAKLSLDPESVAAALTLPLNDPLARATVWASMWSMVRDGELPAPEFIKAVSELGLQIPEAAVVSTLLRQADAAAQRYTPAAHQHDVETRFAARLAEALSQENGGDAQLAAARTLASLSLRHASQLDLLAGLLDGSAVDFGISGLEVDEQLRWAFLQALAAHGRVEKDQLDAELEAKKTTRGAIAHRMALAARPGQKIKDAGLQQALTGQDEDGQELSNDHLSAVIDGFTADPQGLTSGYESDYFEALNGVWSSMTLGNAGRVVRGLFPSVEHLEPGQAPAEHPAVSRTAAWLEENAEAPRALRRLILEEQDSLLRSLRAQANVGS
ncbi:aminopeptidase N [Nesterenkonia populi]|uniref:aminopeptidase N n=1 Tax=Nesterenkonia populi TaxID=1591087 RepID=UPI0011BEE361|nr:aminopeptidase N [Nesterenkonia populi]